MIYVSIDKPFHKIHGIATYYPKIDSVEIVGSFGKPFFAWLCSEVPVREQLRWGLLLFLTTFKRPGLMRVGYPFVADLTVGVC